MVPSNKLAAFEQLDHPPQPPFFGFGDGNVLSSLPSGVIVSVGDAEKFRLFARWNPLDKLNTSKSKK